VMRCVGRALIHFTVYLHHSTLNLKLPVGAIYLPKLPAPSRTEFP
jgi:hypothetical protein